MDQDWFEMRAIRKRKLNNAVWIPLRALSWIEKGGRFGFLGFKEDLFAAGTVAVPLAARAPAEKLGWFDIGLSLHHRPRCEEGTYLPCDIFDSHVGFQGVHLVLEQRANQLEITEWHLQQDLVLALDLKREDDFWVSPNEGYIEVARLQRDANGSPAVIEIRSEHLKDYLSARGMALYVTSYRNRHVVVEDADHINWPTNPMSETGGGDRWEGRTGEIHEGGHPFGAKTAVFHASRTDVDPEEEVPCFGLPTGESISSRSWSVGHEGRRLFSIQGELWRNEWVEPAVGSPRVRGDKLPPTAFFVTDAVGTRENRETLGAGGRWLWFRPEAMMALAHRRGGGLAWYTRDTGSVWCSPDYSVHFGVNRLGLVNVYAKDIALLPDWQQGVWAGYNVGPDGGVSDELLASQVRADPATTQAPEAFLAKGLEHLDSVVEARIGTPLRRRHDQLTDIVERCHRFRAVDRAGLFALAKDLARITADSIDAAALQRFLDLPKEERLGSLKSLERLVATKVGPQAARLLLGPLVGIYELRLADAHLPTSRVSESFTLVAIDESASPIRQGFQMLDACVSAIYSIAKELEV